MIMRQGLLIVLMAAGLPGLLAGQTFDRDKLDRALDKYDNQQFGEVIALLEPEMETINVPVGAYQMLSSSFLRKGNTAKALEYVKQGIKEHERSLDLRLLEVEALQHRSPERALDSMKALMAEEERGLLHSRRYSRDELNAFKARLHMLRGQEYLTQTRYEEAIEQFATASELDEANVEGYRGLLYAYHQAGRHEALLEAFSNVPEAMQTDRQITALRSHALMELEETEELLETYRQRYERDPGDLDSALIYGQLLLENNQIIAANELFNELLDRHPEERKIYDHLLEMNRRQMNFAEAANLLERMIEMFPEDDELPFELAHAYRMQREEEKALAVYDSLKASRGNTYLIARPRAALLVEQDEVEQAYKTLEESVVRTETAGKAMDLGKIALQNDESERAAGHFADYLEANPTDSLALVLKGRAHLKNSQTKEAAEMYRRAVERGAYWPEVYIHLFQQNPVMAGDPDKWFEALANTFEEIRAHEEMLAMQAQFAMQTGTMSFDEPFYPPEKQLEDMRVSMDELQKLAFESLPEEQMEAVLWDLQQEHGDLSGIYGMAGDFYRRTEATDKALTAYREGIDADSENEEIILNLAEVYKEMGETGEAILWYERALNIDAGTDIYSNLIKLHREQGTLDNLIDRWLIRYESGHSDELLREHLIEALHRAGRMEEAREIVQDG